MALNPVRRSKSIRVPQNNEDGEEVFVTAAQFGTTGIFINFEMLNPDWCANHTEDLQEAISAFLPQLNALLAADNLPIIQGAK